jgi:hypothetical protein
MAFMIGFSRVFYAGEGKILTTNELQEIEKLGNRNPTPLKHRGKEEAEEG